MYYKYKSVNDVKYLYSVIFTSIPLNTTSCHQLPPEVTWLISSANLFLI